MSLLIDPAIVKHSAQARSRPDDGVPLTGLSSQRKGILETGKAIIRHVAVGFNY